MDLINKENGIGLLFQSMKHSLETLFKVTAIFGARKQCSHIKGVDLSVQQQIGNIFIYNSQGQPFGYGGFTNTCIAYQKGVVLSSATENVHAA